jgi:hypothetical protein
MGFGILLTLTEERSDFFSIDRSPKPPSIPDRSRSARVDLMCLCPKLML